MEPRLLLVLGVLAAATALGLLWRARAGRFAAARSVERLTPADIGVDLGPTGTLVQLSAEVCAPCRATAAALGALADERPDLAHVELDVAERMDLVRRFGVLRTPTVLVLDATGAVRGRLTGATSRVQALAAVDGLVAAAGSGAAGSAAGGVLR